MHLNDCFLVGTLAKDPESRFADSGSQATTARLCVSEARDGKTFRVYIPLEAWGTAAAMLAELSEGDEVLIRGKLKWKSWETKDGKKQGSVIVAAWSVQTVGAAVAVDSSREREHDDLPF